MSGFGKEGVLVIDKPRGMTSFDVIRALRGPLGTRALGHTGTLDPNATGVLCVCAGWALKLQRFLDDDVKVYRAEVRLGETTDTDDAEGSVIDVRRVSVAREELERAVGRFVGRIEQVPPIYSAIKQGGERAYTRARRGERVALPPRPVRIDRIDVEHFDGASVRLLVTCGRGTYIRSIARDLGRALDCGGHLHSLRRLVSGVFAVEQAADLESLLTDLRAGGAAPFVSPMAMLAHLPLVLLPDPQQKRFMNGLQVPLSGGRFAEGRDPLVRIGDREGRLVAVGALEERGGTWFVKPVKVRPASPPS